MAAVDCSQAPVFPDLQYIAPEVHIALLRTMIRIRGFEERIADLITDKQIITPCHLYTGQEAIAAGVCAALKKSDYLFGNHRSHGHYLAKGGDMQAAMAEIFGRASGCSHGRGGSMHLCSPDVGIMGTSSIVAGSMAIGVGAALAESIRGSGGLSVIFHGDGVPEEGIWHEAANFAGLKHLPVLFVCENNYYCTHMSMERRKAYNNLTDLAAAHGFKTMVLDGNNVLEIYAAASQAASESRRGEGPYFLECQTYRWRGHVGPNYDLDLGLRDPAELQLWMERDPIKHYEMHLLKKKTISHEEALAIHEEAVQEVEAAIEYALASPYPQHRDLLKHVYEGEEA